MPSNYDEAFIFQLYFFVSQSCQGLTVYAACKQLLTNGLLRCVQITWQTTKSGKSTAWLKSITMISKKNLFEQRK